MSRPSRMVTTALLLMGSDALASERVRWSEARMCEVTEVVAFARVVGRESVYKPRPGVPMWTYVDLEVEISGHGSPPSTFTVLILGGESEGQTIVASGSPDMPIGERYLLFLRPFPPDDEVPGRLADRTRPERPQNAAPGTRDAPYQVLEWFEVAPRGDLPSQDLMKAVWEGHCGQASLSVGAPRPTEKVAQWLPAWFSDWCEHD